jgi:exodeoxyribonuclease VII small subunit
MAAKNNSAEGTEKNFETALAELEQIVSELESGEKPLDESLALYEKGVAALKHCHGILDKAEKRIRLLVQGQGGEPVVQDGELPAEQGKTPNRRLPVKPASSPPPDEPPASGDPF